MTNKSYKKPLSISQQKEGMKRWPCFCAQPSNNDHSISWLGQIQPLDDSDTYIVEIRYDLLFHPYISVLHPKIKPSTPHMNRNGSLCLYHPNDPYHLKWTPNKLISETITCWTAEWLANYEFWLDSGKWFGLEAQHN